MIYYVYLHLKLTDNVPFYVGIGRTEIEGTYSRAYTKSKRTEEWKAIAQHGYLVKIEALFLDEQECCQREVELIAKFGRAHLGEGLLVNKCPGGYKWKDSIPIFQYSLHGEFLSEWASPKIAAAVLDLPYTCIYKSCRIGSIIGKYQFRTYKADNIEPYNDDRLKPIFQFTRTGILVNSYTSIIEAAKAMNTSPEFLGQCANRKVGSAKGYIWSFDKAKCFVKRLIIQSSISGEEIGRYPTLIDAKNSLNLSSHNSIDNAIKGKKQKQAYGFLWKELKNTYVNAG
jgi:hypothetical protein